MGGGGDGGAGQARQDELARQAKVQAATDVINAKFGIAPSTAQAAPTADQFMTGSTPGTSGWSGNPEQGGSYESDPGTPGTYDDAGFKKAMADWQAQQDAVGANKTAREALYTDIDSATHDVNQRDLDQQFGTASKQNLFGLARSGLLGGSVDAESGADLQRRYGEGELRATQAGDAAASDLRSEDEKTRQNLISMAQSGLDTGTAASLAAGQMGAAADLAKSNTASSSLGDLFANLSQGYLGNKVLAARYPNGLPATPSGTNFFSNLFSGNGYAGTVTR